MVTYEILQKLKEQSLLKLAFQKGLIPFTVISNVDIYECYIKELETNKKTDACNETALKMNVSERKVFRVIKIMES